MEKRFFSIENKIHILDVVNAFLYDKFAFRLLNNAKKDDILMRMQPILEEVYDSGLSLLDLNKRAMSVFKEQMKTSFNLDGETAGTVAVTPSPPLLPHSLPVMERSEQPLKNKDFLQKVKELSESRAPLEIPKPPPAPAPTVPNVPLGIIVTPPSTGGRDTVPFVSSSHSRIIAIRSWDRDWLLYSSRDIMIWAGSLSTSDISMAIVSVLLPKGIETPYVNLEITGVSNKKNTYILVRKQETTTTTTYVPLTEQVAVIDPSATPWTIKLLDADGDSLSLGSDSATVTAIETANFSFTKLSLDNCNISDFSIGDLIVLKNSPTNYFKTVVKDVTVSGTTTMITIPSHDSCSIGTRILNMNRQFCIFIEVKP